MKKTAIYITVGALLLTLSVSQPVIASEISGTISTDGNSTNNSDTPTPTPTPTPDPTTGHSSEVSNGDSGLSGVVVGGANAAQVFAIDGMNIYHGSTSIDGDTASTTASTTPGISDEEKAHLAMLEFGPRYGVSGFTPGAPDAGGYGNLSVGGAGKTSDDSALFPSVEEDESPFAYVPRSGEGPVLPEQSQLAASALANAAGLSMPQLILIAIIGLILLASMGYAISRANQRTGTPA